MIGDPALREIVGADALRAIATTDQRLALGGLLRFLLLFLGVVDARLQQRHRARPVLVLRTFVLAFDHSAGRDVRQANRRIGLVDVLSASPGCAKRVDAQVRRIDFNHLHFFAFGNDCNGCRRGMHTSLGLCLRHALNPVGTGFEFQFRVCALADDARDDFLVAAVLALVAVQNLEFPVLRFGIAAVHAKQIAGEDRRFVAAGAGAYLEKHIGAVVGIAR